MEKTIILLSGFLGSGKTTLIRTLLKTLPDEEVALLINDFGKEAIDEKYINKEDSISLVGGSIFCQCLKNNFYKALIKLIKENKKYILIEASGMANPATFKDVIAYISQKEKLPMLRVIKLTVVDALSFLETREVINVVSEQVKYSDLVIISKTDLVDIDKVTKLKETIKNELNVNSLTKEEFFRDFDEKLSLIEAKNKGSQNEDTIDKRPFCVSLGIMNSPTENDFLAFLTKVSPVCYRIKGFAKLKDGIYKVDLTTSAVNIERSIEENETMLSVISKDRAEFLYVLKEQKQNNKVNFTISF